MLINIFKALLLSIVSGGKERSSKHVHCWRGRTLDMGSLVSAHKALTSLVKSLPFVCQTTTNYYHHRNEGQQVRMAGAISGHQKVKLCRRFLPALMPFPCSLWETGRQLLCCCKQWWKESRNFNLAFLRSIIWWRFRRKFANILLWCSDELFI